MTDEEWVSCTDPAQQLDYLHRKQTAWKGRVLRWLGRRPRSTCTGRKLRLFACACCRQTQRIMAVPHLARMVETKQDRLSRCERGCRRCRGPGWLVWAAPATRW
jgi:hypothetical protein